MNKAPFVRLALSMLALSTLALSGCAEPGSEATEATEPSASAKPPPTTEYLVASEPAGWLRTAQTDTVGLRLTEFIPADPTDAADGETLSFESLTGNPLPDPIEFLTTMGEDASDGCEGFNHYNTFSGLENNYPTSVRLFVCNRNLVTDQGEVTLIKAIRGNDYFYVITRTRQIAAVDEQTDSPPIAKEEMAAWSLYMRGISVCDPRVEDHPCPEPNGDAS